jgi:hypothetical protein
MTAAEFYAQKLVPSLDAIGKFAPELTRNRDSEALMLAIAGQESDWTAMHQVGGPANGPWEFEPNGVKAVYNHSVCGPILRGALKALGMGNALPETLYQEIATEAGTVLATLLARLLLWSSPARLPVAGLGQMRISFLYYENCWRPGKPDLTRWNVVYPQALSAVQ